MSTSLRKLWPFTLYLVVCLIMTAGIVRLLESNLAFLEQYNGLPQVALLAWMSGQGYGIMLIAGLMGATWSAGLVLATAWLILIALAFSAGFESNFGDFFTRSYEACGNWPIVAILPASIFLASAPLLACRFLAGWRLTRSDMASTPRERLTISDFFRFTTMLASIGLLCRAGLILHPDGHRDLLEVVLITLVFATGLCLLVLVPALFLDWKLTRSRLLWLWMLLLASCFGAGSMLIMCLTQDMDWNEGLLLAFLFPCQIITGWIGIACLTRSGFRMIRYAPKSTQLPAADAPSEDTVENPFEDATPPVDQRLSSRSAWLIPIGTAALAMLLMGVQSYWTQYWKALTDKNLAIEQMVTAAGGHAAHESYNSMSRVIWELQLPPTSQDVDLQKCAECEHVRTLILANTHITDKGLEAISYWRNLTDIQLNNTSITDAGLQSLKLNSLLDTLSISHSQVSAKGIALAFQQFPEMTRFDASGLGLKGGDLQPLKHANLISLSLADNALNDASMLSVNWQNMPSLDEIDLSGNPIHGAGLAGMRMRSFDFHRVPLRDAELAQAVPTMYSQDQAAPGVGQEFRTSFAHTELTDEFLKQLSQVVRLGALELGDGNFTDQGLAAAQMSNISQLTLSGKQFSGECFRTWQPLLACLDMSESGLTDAGAALIAKLQIPTLILSHTDITDAALPALAQSSSEQIYLDHTKITYQGLIANPFPKTTYVLVADTFSREERQALEQLANIRFVN